MSTFKTMFSTDFSTPVPVKPGQEPIRGKIILRSYNGTDSFRKINDSSQYRDQFNIYRGVFGVPAETTEVNLRFGDY
ncbi:MAG: hypothetical protein MJ200_04905 [Mycoplasmoidaceae bacterium]|nr:hypothetical protein [Mycoplasmoidaceae bacterium]